MSQKLKGSTRSGLAYTGTVKLSQYLRGKKFTVAEIHNEGGKPLFDFLADCLAGDFNIAEVNRPKKIRLLNIGEDSNENFDFADSTSFIYLFTEPERVYNESAGVIRYSFIMPQEYFAAGKANNATRFNAIGLYAESAESARDYAAYCRVNTDGWTISISSVLVLDWELQITNEEKPY
jgi:hypothetical protein